jgi:oleandomycin transport system permease protein
VQNSLFTTLNTATGLSTDLEKGLFDRLRSLPIARFAPLSGRILADIAKQAWAVIMLLAIGYILGFRVGTGPLGVLAAFGLVLISTLAVSWALVLVAMLAANPEKVQIFGFVVLFPLTFTSDAFVRTASMPGWLQAWAKANPVSLISDAMRGLMVSGPAARPAVESLLYAAAFTIVFAPLAVRAFKRRVGARPAPHVRRRSPFPRLGPNDPWFPGPPRWPRAARRPAPGRLRAARDLRSR